MRRHTQAVFNPNWLNMVLNPVFNELVPIFTSLTVYLKIGKGVQRAHVLFTLWKQCWCNWKSRWELKLCGSLKHCWCLLAFRFPKLAFSAFLSLPHPFNPSSFSFGSLSMALTWCLFFCIQDTFHNQQSLFPFPYLTGSESCFNEIMCLTVIPRQGKWRDDTVGHEYHSQLKFIIAYTAFIQQRKNENLLPVNKT